MIGCRRAERRRETGEAAEGEIDGGSEKENCSPTAAAREEITVCLN